MSIYVVQTMVLQLPCLCGSVQYGLHLVGRNLESPYATEASNANPSSRPLPLVPSFHLQHACARQTRHAVKYVEGRWNFRNRLRSWPAVDLSRRSFALVC